MCGEGVGGGEKSVVGETGFDSISLPIELSS